MQNFGIWEWLVILVIVLVVFGASRLRDVGKGLGGAVSAFRSEVKKGREEEKEVKEVSKTAEEGQGEPTASLQPRA